MGSVIPAGELCGVVTIALWDPNGYCIERVVTHNRLYKTGVEVLWLRAFGQNNIPAFAWLAAGQNGNPNSEAMTGLGDERYRAPITSVNWNSTTEELVMRHIMGKTAGNGFTFREAMIVNASPSGGTMLCRVPYADKLKDANNILTFEWKLKLTRALT
ncbi:MAG: hypothetical protein U0172_03475 [Nitrospiraceae bacterium]